jgi:hypothetical protein
VRPHRSAACAGAGGPFVLTLLLGRYQRRPAHASFTSSRVEISCEAQGDPRGQDHVPGQFDVDRALVAQGGVNHPVDFALRGLRIIQDGGGDGELVEEPQDVIPGDAKHVLHPVGVKLIDQAVTAPIGQLSDPAGVAAAG